jgi:hypothetical protein
MPKRFTIAVGAVDLEHGGERPAGEHDLALNDYLRIGDPSEKYDDYELMPNLFDPRPAWGKVVPIIGNSVLFALGPDENGNYCRQDTTNLAIAEPNWDGNREERRKAELVRDIYPRFDLIVARHGTRFPGFNYALCHADADPSVWNVVYALGIEHVTHPVAPSTAGLLRNYVCIDLAPDSGWTAAKLRQKLGSIAAGKQFKQRRTIREYVNDKDITMHDARRIGLPRTMAPFTPFSPSVTEALGLLPGTVALSGGIDTGDWYAECGRLVRIREVQRQE